MSREFQNKYIKERDHRDRIIKYVAIGSLALFGLGVGYLIKSKGVDMRPTTYYEKFNLIKKDGIEKMIDP